MKIVNRDMTREIVQVYVSGSQIFVKIFAKSHGKWHTETYFVSYDFNVDPELVESTIKYIVRVWGLKNPIVRIE